MSRVFGLKEKYNGKKERLSCSKMKRHFKWRTHEVMVPRDGKGRKEYKVGDSGVNSCTESERVVLTDS